MKWLVISVLFLFVAGCGEKATVGFGAGLLIGVERANAEMKRLDANIDILAEKSGEVEAVIESGLLNIIGVIDPNLKDGIDGFVVNLRNLKADAEKFEDEKGKVDWERIIYTSLLGIFSGGTGVNLYKNRKTS